MRKIFVVSLCYPTNPLPEEFMCHIIMLILYSMLVCWLCIMSHRQRGHLETAPPFTVPCEGRGAQFLHCSHWESNPGPSCGSPLYYRCVCLIIHVHIFCSVSITFNLNVLKLIHIKVNPYQKLFRYSGVNMA